MSTFNSKTGKRYSRKKIEERHLLKEKKKGKPVTILGIFMVLFSIFLLVFFARERSKGIARENAPAEFSQVTSSMNELDGIDIFTSKSYVYNNHYDQFMENSALARVEKENSEATSPPIERPERRPGKLDNDIKLYLRDEGIDPASIGYVYFNLNDGTYSSLNESEIFQAGETTRLPIVMYLFDQADNERIDLNKRLMVEDKHLDGEDGPLKDVSPGSTYSLFDLAELAISQEDDVATNIFYDFLGSYNGEYLLDALARVYGISTYDGNYMTPDEALILLRSIYYNEGTNPLYYDLLEFLKNTENDEYFTKNIDEDNIAHITGEAEGYYGDIGIVQGEESSYAYAVYTNNIKQSETVLNDLGKIVHSWHTGASD